MQRQSLFHKNTAPLKGHMLKSSYENIISVVNEFFPGGSNIATPTEEVLGLQGELY